MSTTLAWALRERPELCDEVRASAAGCLIVGPAGVGKTTLARQAVERADRPAVVVRGIEGLASVPFAALGAARAEATGEGDGPDGDVVRRLRLWLGELARDGVWVLVDDADALDPPSSGLLSYAAQAEGLHLVVTMRTGHHLPSDLERVSLHQSWATVTIEPWSVAEVRDALAEALGGPISAALATAVHDLSGGIPLVARELVLEGVAASRIRFDGREWKGAPSAGSPESAARLIGRRLPTGGPALEVLQMLAIAGQLRPELLDALAPEDVLIELDAQGLLEFPSGTTVPYVRLAHPMVADALRSGLDERERHRRLVTLVHASRANPAPDDLDVLQSLHWAIEIGEDLDPDALHAGSALALRHMDYALAADIAGELGRREPSARAAFVHAVALARAARFDEALAIADGARPLATTDEDVVALARTLVRLHSPFGRVVGYVGGRPDHAAAVAGWADGRLGGHAFADLLAAYTAFVEGDLDTSIERAAAVAADPAAAPGVVEEADELLVLLGPLRGRFDVARTSQARLSASSDGAVRLPALMGGDGAKASLLMYDGRLREARAVDDASVARAQRALAYDEIVNAAAQQGIRAYLMGDLDRCVEALELSLQYRVVPTSRSLLVHGILAAARLLRGEADLALRILEQADLDRDTFTSRLVNLDYDHLATFVRAAAGAIERGEAEARLRAIADEAAGFGYGWLQVNTRLSLVRLGRMGPADAEALQATVTDVDAPLIRTVADVVLAAVAGDAARLVDLADALAAMDAHLVEVDALGAALRATGAGAPAIEARLDQALAACTGLDRPTVVGGGIPTAPAGPASPVHPNGNGAELTEREAEIANLAADGLASKLIADRLGLSPRTVDNTLRRVYTKLGASGRRDLARFLPGR